MSIVQWSRRRLRRASIAAAVCAATLHAQVAAAPPEATAAPRIAPAAAGRADPLDAPAAVPPPALPTTLTRRRHAEPVPENWRAANERVERIGGWKAYAREAAASAAGVRP